MQRSGGSRQRGGWERPGRRRRACVERRPSCSSVQWPAKLSQLRSCSMSLARWWKASRQLWMWLVLLATTAALQASLRLRLQQPLRRHQRRQLQGTWLPRCLGLVCSSGTSTHCLRNVHSSGRSSPMPGSPAHHLCLQCTLCSHQLLHPLHHIFCRGGLLPVLGQACCSRALPLQSVSGMHPGRPAAQHQTSWLPIVHASSTALPAAAAQQRSGWEGPPVVPAVRPHQVKRQAAMASKQQVRGQQEMQRRLRLLMTVPVTRRRPRLQQPWPLEQRAQQLLTLLTGTAFMCRI